MPLPILMPVGIIETHEQEESFTFLRLPVDHEYLDIDQDVVVWNYYNGALAKCRGVVTELTKEGASVRITHKDVETSWPETLDPFGYANPVYIAGDPTLFNGDQYQPLQTQEMLVPDNARKELLAQLSQEHQTTANIPPAHGTIVRPILPDGFYDVVHD